MSFDWFGVILDFGSMLDEPGSKAAIGLQALTDDLGLRFVPKDVPRHESEHWADWLQTVGEAGTPALLARLEHPSLAVRRASAFVLTYCSDPLLPEALRAHLEKEQDAPTTLTLLIALGGFPEQRAYLRELTTPTHAPITRCGAALGLVMRPFKVSRFEEDPTAGAELDDHVIEALTIGFTDDDVASHVRELPWTEPEWNHLEDVVDMQLRPLADALARWLTRMLTLVQDGQVHSTWAESLCWDAGDLHNRHPGLGEPLGRLVGELLRHPETNVRLAAMRSISCWLGDPEDPARARHLDQIAAALDTPGLDEMALGVLITHGDPRCVPTLQRMIREESMSLRMDGPRNLQTNTTLLNSLLSKAAPFAEELMPAVRARLASEEDPQELVQLIRAITPWAGLQAALPELRGLEESPERWTYGEPKELRNLLNRLAG
ncbi:hypothetical protein [Acrocarpospora catenulata]|uniref:hypothetical protein n=1 Tax=Acrocarpospora catenulata TaxID=2836182 RepID=UPI001BDA99E7|nr:hypothetical protein [Acrocarpospora catenulata]